MSREPTAADAMDERCLIIEPSLAVDQLASQLDEQGIPGALVVEDGALVGVVTEMDLVFRNKRVHLPTVIAIFEAVIPFDPGGRAKAELVKATGATAAEIMTRDVVTATPTTPLADVAAWMVDQSLSMVPVLDAGRVVGVVTRRSAMRQAFRPSPD